MPLNELDANTVSNLISLQVDQVTCIECCKYYIVPTTAGCGHTLCHGCWSGRKTCASCGASVDRKALKLNLHLQNQTEHAHVLGEEFERIFKVQLDDFLLGSLAEKRSKEDPSKHVKDWLQSSENQFSAPETIQHSTQDSKIEHHANTTKIQVHDNSSKSTHKNIVHVEIPQDDWDKIEELPDTEELICKKNKENAIGPMDIEPFVIDQLEFTTDNPRRSSRKRDIKGSNPILDSDINTVDKNSTKNSASDADTNIKSKTNWASVKRMKKEFSKLNKKNKNKLNVSIEMCKKTQSSANKNMPSTNISTLDDLVPNIDENTPIVDNLNQGAPTKQTIENNKLHNNLQQNNSVNKLIHKKEFHQNIENTIPVINQGITVNKPIQENNLSQNNQALPVSFIMKGALQACSKEKMIKDLNSNHNVDCINVTTDNVATNTDDIEITIKIGNTLTNICIKKNNKDVQLKINTDKEIQTSLDKCEPVMKNVSSSPIKEKHCPNNLVINIQNNDQIISNNVRVCQDSFVSQEKSKYAGKNITNDKNVSVVKTSSTKKNTESADTATVQYEITESIEKELSKDMEKADQENSQKYEEVDANQKTDNEVEGEDYINDMDLFENDSVKDVQSLTSSHHAPSEILVSTIKSKNRKDKRTRDENISDVPTSKRLKSIQENTECEKIVNTPKTNQSKNCEQDSEITNYDAIMGQVFANIDADIEDLEKKSNEMISSQSNKIEKDINPPVLLPADTLIEGDTVHALSENIFSMIEKQNDLLNTTNVSQFVDPKSVENMKTITQNQDAPMPIDDITAIDPEQGTPAQNNDDSDEGVVEETPQKSESFMKGKQRNVGDLKSNIIKNRSLKLKRCITNDQCDYNQSKTEHTENVVTVINLTDTTSDPSREIRQTTIIEAGQPRKTLETPLTLTKFMNQVTHKSTPMARKSLNFDKENTEIMEIEPDQTLCSSSFVVAKTTQEREFMSKAFEDSPSSRSKSPLTTRNPKIKKTNYCLAGSCLTPFEISNVKNLCSLRNWQYVDKYTKDLTHLVVGVDEEKKSERSVKYMCALAGGKWIVSYEWVHKCLQLKNVIDEEPFEALDCTGEPGPRRSRLAKQKLFRGITFFCMPPFSVLDVDTLKGMLEAAGGRVVDEARAVRAAAAAPALLLAEPEHTQEDRFIYLAMELSIVPVNYEWVLNCLGNYTISSVQELLLCPPSLLPPATAQWPQSLMAKDYDSTL